MIFTMYLIGESKCIGLNLCLKVITDSDVTMARRLGRLGPKCTE